MSIRQRVSSLVQRAYREYFLPTSRNLTGLEVDRLEVFSGELVGILEDLVRSVVGQKPSPQPPAPAGDDIKTVRRGSFDVTISDEDACDSTSPSDPFWNCSLVKGHAGMHAAFCNGDDGMPEENPEATWVDAAGNVLEGRAEAAAPEAKCQVSTTEWDGSLTTCIHVAGHSGPHFDGCVTWTDPLAPAPREPDGWVVVNDHGRCAGTWTRGEVDDPEKRAKSFADKWSPGWTARPFWLDTPPVHTSSLTDVVTTLEEERNMLRANIAALREASDVAVTVRDAEAATLRAEVGRLRAALRAIAMTVGALVSEQAGTEIHCAVADEVRLVVERLTRDLSTAHVENYARTKNHMDAIYLARLCREVALGERGRLSAVLSSLGYAHGADLVRGCSAPTLPEVP